MLYIFRVDTGSMMTLEMSLALETVAHLRRAVASTWSIPEDKQVGLESKTESCKNLYLCKYLQRNSNSTHFAIILPFFFLQIIAFQLRTSEEPILLSCRFSLSYFLLLLLTKKTGFGVVPIILPINRLQFQVLLISGGESLEPDERVCKYTAGSSDTNPIFLFSMARLHMSS